MSASGAKWTVKPGAPTVIFLFQPGTAEAAKLRRMLWTLLALVAVVAWVVALVDIVRRRHELASKQLVAWILLVVILPVVGTVLYFALGRKPAVA